MTTIKLDDELINQVIAVSHNQNAQEAVIKILADYLQHRKNEPLFFDQIRIAGDSADDELSSLFHRDKDMGRSIEL
jgi:hypothetical protein